MCEGPLISEAIERLAKRLLPRGYSLKAADLNMYRYNIYHENKPIPMAQFGLTPLPGCECAVLVSHGAWVADDHRGKGLGTALLQIRTEAIKQAGYALALATVRSDNQVERKLLYKAGWRRARSFTPYPHLDHTVQLWILRPESEKERR